MKDYYHKNSLCFCKARDCLRYLLSIRAYEHIYIPNFICGEVVDVISSQNVRITHYHINASLEPLFSPQLSEKEAFYYINYFGLKQDCVMRLSMNYGSRLIVDNAQAFFSPPINGIDSFYSARKYYGVKDGAFLYLREFQEGNNTKNLCGSKHLGHSKSIEMLRNIDYDRTILNRCKNYLKYEKVLHDTNQLCVSLRNDSVPMVYPYYPTDNTIKKRIEDNGFVVEQFWPYVLSTCTIGDFDYKIALHMIPLFVGQDCPDSYFDEILNLIVP